MKKLLSILLSLLFPTLALAATRANYYVTNVDPSFSITTSNAIVNRIFTNEFAYPTNVVWVEDDKIMSAYSLLAWNGDKWYMNLDAGSLYNIDADAVTNGYMRTGVLGTNGNIGYVLTYNGTHATWQIPTNVIGAPATNAFESAFMTDGGVLATTNGYLYEDIRLDTNYIKSFTAPNTNFALSETNLNNDTWKVLRESTLNDGSSWNNALLDSVRAKLVAKKNVSIFFEGTGLVDSGLFSGLYTNLTAHFPLAGLSSTRYPWWYQGAVSSTYQTTKTKYWFSDSFTNTADGAYIEWWKTASCPKWTHLNVYYIKHPEGGTLLIQTNNGLGGPYSTIVSLDTYDATSPGVGAVYQYDSPKAGGDNWSVRLYKSGANGTNITLSPGFLSTNVSGGIILGQQSASSATTAQILAPGETIRNPIIQDWNPDLWVYQNVGGTNVSFTTNVAPYINHIQTNLPNTPLLICGNYPQADNSVQTGDSLSRSNAVHFKAAYYDGFSPFESFSNSVARGFTNDVTHYNSTGFKIYSEFLWSWMDLCRGFTTNAVWTGAFVGDGSGLTNLDLSGATNMAALVPIINTAGSDGSLSNLVQVLAGDNVTVSNYQQRAFTISASTNTAAAAGNSTEVQYNKDGIIAATNLFAIDETNAVITMKELANIENYLTSSAITLSASATGGGVGGTEPRIFANGLNNSLTYSNGNFTLLGNNAAITASRITLGTNSTFTVDVQGNAVATSVTTPTFNVGTLNATNFFIMTNVVPPATGPDAGSCFIWNSNNHGLYIVTYEGTAPTGTNEMFTW